MLFLCVNSSSHVSFGMLKSNFTVYSSRREAILNCFKSMHYNHLLPGSVHVMLLIPVSYNYTFVKKLPQCWFKKLAWACKCVGRRRSRPLRYIGKKVIYVGWSLQHLKVAKTIIPLHLFFFFMIFFFFMANGNEMKHPSNWENELS